MDRVPDQALTAGPEGERPPEPTVEQDGRDHFERALTREILISERLRVTLLALIPGVGMIAFLALSAIYPDLSHRLFRVEMDRVRVGMFLGVVAVYEFFALFQVEKLIRSSKKPPVMRRYLNAFIEASLPTFVVVYYMTVVDNPVDALLLPPASTYFIFILLSTLRLDFGLCVFTGVVSAVEYGLIANAAITSASAAARESVLATTQHHLGKALILLVSGVAAGFVARRLRRGFENTFRELEERARVLSVFGQHVSPAVADRLLAQRAESRGEVRDVCVMFLDIRNFTAFSETRTPEEVVTYLNSVFEFMVHIVNDRHGIVNKFLGDGFMAVFGAPLRDEAACAHALDAALAIVAELESRVARGDIPPTRIGIGLHAGPAVIGNVGSGERKEYTVIGDVVNLASRVEALTKELGAKILVTDTVWTAAGRDDIEPISREAIAIRGREQKVSVVELA